MTPYERDALAWMTPATERADAFDVVADAFEEAGNFKAAALRRAWAQTMRECLVVNWAAIPGALRSSARAPPPPGQTRQMIDAAVALAEQGQTVLLMVAGRREVARIDKMARALCERRVRAGLSKTPANTTWRRIYVECDEELGRARSFNVRFDDHLYQDQRQNA